MNDLIHVHPSVAEALEDRAPLVALESTIITHGMPYPDNLAMALSVEKIIAEAGATPALVAVIDGQITVGLNDEERESLAKTKSARKVSRADLAYAAAFGENAGTTVAATMLIANSVGIHVFATGGIGGVHKGASESFDISADLLELARSSVIVVAAGAKAILDIPKTLEVLETQGVPVIGYGTDKMPAFWSQSSPWDAPLRLDSAREIATFRKTRDGLGIEGGMLVANPIPAASDIPFEEMQGYIDAAQLDLERHDIQAKEVTPFLLGRIVELTQGRSLKSNIALVENNAKVAADIARALAAG
ncbi:MAG: pseudouridine-5'-phosphate glycosidase [Pseudomonadota bacterium]